VRRTPIVIVGTVAGLVGVLSFHTTPAHLTLGVLPATSAPRSSPTTSVAAGSPPGPGSRGANPSPTSTSSTTSKSTPTTTPGLAPTLAPTPTTTRTPATTPATTPTPTTRATTPPTTIPAAPRSANGSAVNYHFGVLSVSVTVTGGKITQVGIASLNDGGNSRSQSIDQQSIPVLEQQALQAQSANIQGVSGASYTSAGFIQSLQSALSQLGFS
jgi:uncharacterized protein with FMN-binding domain